MKTFPKDTRSVIRQLALAGVAALAVGCGQKNDAENIAATMSPLTALNGEFMYAIGNDGNLQVYDINNSHNLVKTVRVFTGGADIRGAAAAVPTHRFYVMYNQNSQGHLACLDMLTDQLIWDKVLHTPAVDRGDVTPDGKTIYLPSGEGDTTSTKQLVVDALTGSLITEIPIATLTHDTLVSLDGTKVFMSNKSNDFSLRTANTATNQVTQTIRFANVLQPFVVNGTNTRMFQDVLGIYGFQYADLTTGQVLGTALYSGSTTTDKRPHGIGLTPNEREVWGVARGNGNKHIFVFDTTTLPPVQTHLIPLSNDNQHWITFDIKGRYAYVTGTKNSSDLTEIVSTSSYSGVDTIPHEESILEVDYSNGTVTAVGSQYGVGRVTSGSPPPPPSATTYEAEQLAKATSGPTTTLFNNAAQRGIGGRDLSSQSRNVRFRAK